MKDGQKIVFHGEGDQEPELEPGDVIIVLDQKDHSVFQRRGHDIIMKMKIQLCEALCGFKKTIKTLDDRTLVITSKSGSFRHTLRWSSPAFGPGWPFAASTFKADMYRTSQCDSTSKFKVVTDDLKNKFSFSQKKKKNPVSGGRV